MVGRIGMVHAHSRVFRESGRVLLPRLGDML